MPEDRSFLEPSTCTHAKRRRACSVHRRLAAHPRQWTALYPRAATALSSLAYLRAMSFSVLPSLFGESLVNSSPATVAPLVSSLQLTLNLHDFRHVFRRERDLAGEDYKQHVDERVSRNVRQFSEQVAPPVEQIESRIFLSQFECHEWARSTASNGTCFQLHTYPQRRGGCGGRRALPESGQLSSRG